MKLAVLLLDWLGILGPTELGLALGSSKPREFAELPVVGGRSSRP